MEDVGRRCVDRMVEWLGIPWTHRQEQQLDAYAAWLVAEGVKIGGLGPREAGRVWPRHICDSLAFGRGLMAGMTVLDVGSGVGLPGIPLAVAFPRVRITLLDRSRRRCDALHRVAGHLGVGIVVAHMDVARWDRPVDRLVFRASLRVHAALGESERLLKPGGEGWFALGRGPEPDALLDWRSRERGTENPGLEISEVFIPDEVLDSGAWLLRIAPA